MRLFYFLMIQAMLKRNNISLALDLLIFESGLWFWITNALHDLVLCGHRLSIQPFDFSIA